MLETVPGEDKTSLTTVIVKHALILRNIYIVREAELERDTERDRCTHRELIIYFYAY